MNKTFGIVVLTLALVPKVMSNYTVNPGWDLFVTDPATAPIQLKISGLKTK